MQKQDAPKQLVVDESQRRENARSLADAWGLTGDVEDSDESDTEAVVDTKSRDVSTLERRIEKEKKRVKTLEASQELVEWRDSNEEEDQDQVMKTKSQSANLKPSRRLKDKSVDQIHPVAAQAEKAASNQSRKQKRAQD